MADLAAHLIDAVVRRIACGATRTADLLVAVATYPPPHEGCIPEELARKTWARASGGVTT
jgi:hypothetical protein